MARKKDSPSLEEGTVKARVLTDCAFGKANTVVAVTPEDVEANPGVLDADPAAVEAGEESNEHKAHLAQLEKDDAKQ